MKKILMLILTLSTMLNSAVVIKLGTLAPEGSPWYDVIRNMGEDWKKASNGEVTLKIYAGGSQGDEADMVRKMGIGQLNAASITGVGLSDISPEVQAMQMPMMIQSYEELDYIFSKVGPKLEAKLEAKGYKMLNWGDVGWVRFFSQKKVVYPDDLKDQSMFVWGGDTNVVSAWKDAGFRVVPLAATDILPSLQTKMINAFSTPALSAVSFQWFALAPYMTDLKWAPLIGGTVISKKTWEKIPEKYRPELEKIAAKRGLEMKKEIRGLEDKAIKVMKDNGLKVTPIPADAIKVWTEKARGAYPKLIVSKEMQAMVDEVTKYHEEFIKGKTK